MPPIKRRYIAFKIDSENVDATIDFSSIREGDIVRAVKESLQDLHGDFGMASVIFSFGLKQYHHTTRTGIIGVKREAYQFVSSAMPTVRRIRDLEVTISILALSGTMRGCYKKMEEHHEMMVRHLAKYGEFGKAPLSQPEIDRIMADVQLKKKKKFCYKLPESQFKV